MYDPTGDLQVETAKLEKKLATATGGMRAVLENKIRDQKMQETRMHEQATMQDKIHAETESLKKAALATWNTTPKTEDQK